VALLAACGCRLGEAAALDVEDYDGTRIRITKTFRKPHGIGPPKVRRSRRTITVPVAARPALEFAAGGRTAGILFRRPSGQRYNASTLAPLYGPHCRRLGLPVKRVHALRHSVASHLVAAGCPIADVAKFLGDAPATILQTYCHATGTDPAGTLDELFA
jgi:integrase